jgi:hypothetical protein
MVAIKKIRIFLMVALQPVMFWMAGALVVVGLLFYRLGSLVPGLSPAEAASAGHSRGLRAVLDNPFNAQQALAQHVAIALHRVPTLALRAPSALVGIGFVWLFFYILRHWYSTRVAALDTLLFASSGWFLHTARIGTPLILQLSLLLAIAYGVWLKRTRTGTVAVLIASLMAVWFLYIPGFVWFVVAGIVWQRKSLRVLMSRTPAMGMLAAYALGIVLLVPLMRSFVLHPGLLKQFVGLPGGSLPTITTIGKNLAHIPQHLFLSGPSDATLWVGHVPLMDVFSTGMLVLGVYAYFYRHKLDRARVLLGCTAISVVLVGLGGTVNIAVMLPIMYLVVASGIALMLQQWFTVFPRNPLARAIGVALISSAVFLTIFYYVNQYFMAWPHAPATRALFSLHM